MSTVDIETEFRPEYASLTDERELIQEGCEKIGRKTYIRYVRWDRRKRAYVLEGLALHRSKLNKHIHKNPRLRLIK